MEENKTFENEEITELVPVEDIDVEETNDHDFGKGMAVGALGTLVLYGAYKGGKKLFTWGKGKVADLKAKKSKKDEPIEVTATEVKDSNEE